MRTKQKKRKRKKGANDVQEMLVFCKHFHSAVCKNTMKRERERENTLWDKGFSNILCMYNTFCALCKYRFIL